MRKRSFVPVLFLVSALLTTCAQPTATLTLVPTDTPSPTDTPEPSATPVPPTPEPTLVALPGEPLPEPVQAAYEAFCGSEEYRAMVGAMGYGESEIVQVYPVFDQRDPGGKVVFGVASYGEEGRLTVALPEIDKELNADYGRAGFIVSDTAGGLCPVDPENPSKRMLVIDGGAIALAEFDEEGTKYEIIARVDKDTQQWVLVHLWRESMVLRGENGNIPLDICGDANEVFPEGWTVVPANAETVRKSLQPVYDACFLDPSDERYFDMGVVYPERVEALGEILKHQIDEVDYGDLERRLAGDVKMILTKAWGIGVIQEAWLAEVPGGRMQDFIDRGLEVVIVGESSKSEPPESIPHPVATIESDIMEGRPESKWVYWLGISEGKLCISLPVTEALWNASGMWSPTKNWAWFSKCFGDFVGGELDLLAVVMRGDYVAPRGESPGCMIGDRKRSCNVVLGNDYYLSVSSGGEKFGIPPLVALPRTGGGAGAVEPDGRVRHNDGGWRAR